MTKVNSKKSYQVRRESAAHENKIFWKRMFDLKAAPKRQVKLSICFFYCSLWSLFSLIPIVLKNLFLTSWSKCWNFCFFLAMPQNQGASLEIVFFFSSTFDEFYLIFYFFFTQQNLIWLWKKSWGKKTDKKKWKKKKKEFPKKYLSRQK